MVEQDRTVPYFNLYASDFLAYKSKLTDAEMIEVLQAICDICLFGDSDFNSDKLFQKRYFEKIKNDLSRNAKKYSASVENGKKGGRPKKKPENTPPDDWQEMLEFFDYSCVCCGAKLSKENPPTKDHIMPRVNGGSDDISNLQPLCRECNSSKCADHATDYRLKYKIPDYLKNKWKINLEKTQEKPIGFLSETQLEPDSNLDKTNTIQYNTIQDNRIENNNFDDIKKLDTLSNPIAETCFKMYSDICTNLLPLKFERRSKAVRDLLSEYLYETNNDMDYFKEVCTKANDLKQICDVRLDFKSVLKNHISISNEKFKKGNGNIGSKLKFK